MTPRIHTRAEWRAKYRDGFGSRTVGRLDKWLHHSVTKSPPTTATFSQDAAAVRDVEQIGQDRFKGGISYTFVIPKSGRIFEGHSIGRIGAHTGGRNSVSAGICLLGNYEGEPPTPQQLAALVWLLVEGVRRGWWRQPILTGGHRDVSATACPGGRAYAQIPAVNARARRQTITPITPEESAMAITRDDANLIADRVWKRAQFTATATQAAAMANIKEGQEYTPGRALQRALVLSDRGADDSRVLATVRAQTAAIETLAKSVGVDPKTVTAAVTKAVEDALRDVSITLSVED